MGIFGRIGVGLQLYGLYLSGQAAKKEAAYNAQIALYNQKIAKIQAKDIAVGGAITAEQLESDAIRFADDQLLGFASGGIDITSGVAQQAIEDTARITASDIITLQHNIAKDIWSVEVGATASAIQTQLDNISARNAERASNIAIATALITGGTRLSRSSGDT
jgi:hypothetical protein